ncbi:MAG: FHA domain-containing protein, partial [Myxococcales bacterium]
MEDPATLDVEQLLAERRQTLEAFRDPHRSPYAAVDRRDFSGSHPLVLGSSEDCDVRLEGLRPRHAQIRVDGDSFLVEAIDPGAVVEVAPAGVTRSARVPPGSRVELGRYTVRLSHQNFPALV